MPREQITSVNGSAALLLTEEVLQSLGVHIGDEVDIAVIRGKLILRSLEELEREEKLHSVTDSVFERRASAYQRLAEGAS